MLRLSSVETTSGVFLNVKIVKTRENCEWITIAIRARFNKSVAIHVQFYICTVASCLEACWLGYNTVRHRKKERENIFLNVRMLLESGDVSWCRIKRESQLWHTRIRREAWVKHEHAGNRCQYASGFCDLIYNLRLPVTSKIDFSHI